MADANFTCKTCKHFVDMNQLGVCRRYPTYQNRHKSEWCGEYALTSPADGPIVVQSEETIKKRGRPAKQ